MSYSPASAAFLGLEPATYSPLTSAFLGLLVVEDPVVVPPVPQPAVGAMSTDEFWRALAARELAAKRKARRDDEDFLLSVFLR